MKSKAKTCCTCGIAITKRNDIAINRKLNGRKVIRFYCVACLAESLEITKDDLLEMIDFFKAQGCKLFE